MGKAILKGILTSQAPSPSGTPSQTPTRFIACVTRDVSAQSIKDEISPLTSSLRVLQNENLNGVREADVVILGCKPQMVKTVLGGKEMAEALSGKLLISILAGVPESQIREILAGNPLVSGSEPCRVVRVMPNTASAIGESMTVIATSSPPLPDDLSLLVQWIFTRIGRVVQLSPHLMDASTAVCGSGPAFFALMLEAMIDGGVAMGLPRKEAQVMAAQTMKGAAGLVLEGEHPALLRDKVSTPGGCTIGGLLVLEEGRVRGNIARAVREATDVASQLGKGVTGVNGTRFMNNMNF